MGTSFRFVHAADLHLDSPFKGFEQDLEGLENGAAILHRLRESTFCAFNRIIDLCLAEKADFLLLAGDVFDVADRSLRAQLRLNEGLARLSEAGIPAFLVYGNHDHDAGWRAGLVPPEGVHTFGTEAVESRPVIRDGKEIARVYGISFPTRSVTENLARLFVREADAPFAIALLHANVDSTGGHADYAPCRLAELEAAGFDYWALGHVHEPRILRADAPCVVYAGNPQGRDVREAGERGCYLVSISEGGAVYPEFRAVDCVRWLRRELRIGETTTDQDLYAMLDQALSETAAENPDRDVVVRFEITGRGALHSRLGPAYIEDLVGQLREAYTGGAAFVLIESIRVRTSPALDRDELAQSGTLLGDVVALSRSAQRDPELRDELFSALEPLFAHRIAPLLEEGREEADEPDLLAAATDYLLDLLGDGESTE